MYDYADSKLDSSVYCTTSAGVLCVFHQNRIMDKWIQLDSHSSLSLSLHSSEVLEESALVAGCTNGKAYVLGFYFLLVSFSLLYNTMLVYFE